MSNSLTNILNKKESYYSLINELYHITSSMISNFNKLDDTTNDKKDIQEKHISLLKEYTDLTYSLIHDIMNDYKELPYYRFLPLNTYNFMCFDNESNVELSKSNHLHLVMDQEIEQISHAVEKLYEYVLEEIEKE